MVLVLTVLIIYFAATAAISIVLQKKSKNLEGYYLGQRNLPWPVIMLTFAATWIGASSTLGKSGLAYEIAISAILPYICDGNCFCGITVCLPGAFRK